MGQKPVAHAVGPHGRFIVHKAATINTTPAGIRLRGDEASSKPDDHVVVNDATLLQLSDPGIAQGLGAGLVVVPSAQGIEIARYVLWFPIAVVAAIGKGLHPNPLIHRPKVVQGFGSDAEGLSESGHALNIRVNLNDAFSPSNDRWHVRASC